jgi:hypothetical protein
VNFDRLVEKRPEPVTHRPGFVPPVRRGG